MRLPSTLMMFIQTCRRNCSKLGDNTSLVLPEARYGSGSAISPKAPEKGYFQSSIESGPLHYTNDRMTCAKRVKAPALGRSDAMHLNLHRVEVRRSKGAPDAVSFWLKEDCVNVRFGRKPSGRVLKGRNPAETRGYFADSVGKLG